MRRSSRHASLRARRLGLQLEPLERRVLLAADLVSVSPLDDASAVPVDSDLVLTFSEDVQPGPGSGLILIKNAADDSVVEGISVHSDQVTFDGATVTVNPSNDLELNSNYYVEVNPSAIRDLSGDSANTVLFYEDFERLPMLDSPLALDGEFNPLADVNDYALTFTGTLVVNEPGEYTFGGNSDDGMWLAIDGIRTGNQDGTADIFDFGNDEVFSDNTTHGAQDRLSTCGALEAVTSCVGTGIESYTLDAGEYTFQYGYFERGGGSSGEFFYAKGTLEAFDAAAFAVIGDDSQGIGVTEAGITATTYLADGFQVGDLNTALDLVDGFQPVAEGFPASVVVPTADVWNTGGTGRFNDNHALPGVPETDQGEGTDYSPAPPFGWTNDLADTPAIAEPVFEGWVPLDKNFWTNQQGNQDRTDFTLGENVVAVVDPDAYDDFTDIDPDGGLLNAFYSTPEIDLTDVEANSVNLSLLSSFRSEPTQIAEIRVSFDGGANFDTILQYDGAVVADKDHINEELSLDLDNPAGGSLIVQFAMLQASNDWWWAIDNVQVTGDAAGATFAGIADRESWNFNTFLGETVFFTEAATNASETDGELTLTLQRAGGDPANPISVDYTATSGSAKVGEDFEAASGTIDFLAGETEKTISVMLLDDDAEERSESFTIVLSNASGDVIAGDAATINLRASDGDVLTFQEGAEVTLNGAGTGTNYAGTQDADPSGANGDDVRNNAELNPDGEDGGSQNHALTKFADLFGDGAGQIPTDLPQGVEIASATLTLNVTNEGDAIQVHRMLADWDQDTVTWNNLMFNGNELPGIQGDGIEATESLREFAALPAGVKVVDVTDDLIAWLAGEENFGWGFTPTGTNGVDWSSAEAADVATRPLLTVEFVDVEPVEDDPWPGDANGDDTTDLADFNILKSNFNTSGGLSDGDFNGDGQVDLADFNILKANFNTSRPDAAAAAAIFAALGEDEDDG